MRRSISETPHINLTSVWTFAAVLLLPPLYITAVVAILYAHSALRVWYRLRRVQLFRTMFNTSMVVVTCLIARATLYAFQYQGMSSTHQGGGWTGFGAIVASAAVYFACGALLALPWLRQSTRSLQGLFGGWADNALEVATLCLGAFTAVAVDVLPQLAVAIVPPILLLQRCMLVSHLEIAATTDDKTGVLNTAGWYHVANRELTRTRRRPIGVGVLMIDLDHFKAINDTHGHLAGDDVLKAVADRIAAEVRTGDTVGRFGGEEFVVLLPGAGEADARQIAERIRVAITGMQVITGSTGEPAAVTGLSASIGVATHPNTDTTVDRLLHGADSALYAAKSAGRNRVVVSSSVAA